MTATNIPRLHEACAAAVADAADSYPTADLGATIGHNHRGTPIALRTALSGAAAYAVGRYVSTDDRLDRIAECLRDVAANADLGFAEHFTCDEAESFAEALRLVGLDSTATAFIEAHSWHDEDDDNPEHAAIRDEANRRADYAEACARATTAQGLDPIVAAIRAAGYPVTVEQTGGMTMVAYVPACTSARIDADRLGITSAEAPAQALTTDDADDNPARYLVCVYNGDEEPEGETLDDAATVAEVLAIIADYRDDDAASVEDADARDDLGQAMHDGHAVKGS